MTPSQKKKTNKIRNRTFDLFRLEKQTKNFQQPKKYLLNYFIRHFPEVVCVLDSQLFC